MNNICKQVKFSSVNETIQASQLKKKETFASQRQPPLGYQELVSFDVHECHNIIFSL